MRWGNAEFGDNFGKHAIDVLEHVIVPEPDNAIAVCDEFSGADSIIHRLPGVLPAVAFDHELRRRAGAVDDTIADRSLAAEFPT